MAQVILDHTYTRRRLKKFLQTHGIDTRTFNKRGKKSIKNLHEELRDHDAKLIWDDRIGRVIRFAFSSKLLILTLRGYLLEIGRQHGSSPTAFKTRSWTVSGTRRNSEDWIKALSWEVWEEIGIKIDKSQLEPLSVEAEPTAHESSVYADILSLVVVKKFLLTLEEHFTPEEIKNMPVFTDKIILDGETTVFLEYHENLPEESIEEEEGAALFIALFGDMFVY